MDYICLKNNSKRSYIQLCDLEFHYCHFSHVDMPFHRNKEQVSKNNSKLQSGKELLHELFFRRMTIMNFIQNLTTKNFF